MTAPFATPFIVCSEGGPTHRAEATHAVEFLIADGSFDDLTTEWLYVCSARRCLSGGQASAEELGIHVDTYPLTRELAEDATGLNLSGWVLGSVS